MRRRKRRKGGARLLTCRCRKEAEPEIAAGAYHLKFFEKVAGIFEGVAARSAGAAGRSAPEEARFVERLAEGLAPLKERDPQLPIRAARFVVVGEGPAVLGEVTYPANETDVLGLSGARTPPGVGPSHLDSLGAVLKDESFQAPERLYRLGHLFAATLKKPLFADWFAGSVRSPDWFRALMTASATCSKVLEGDRRSGRGSGPGLINVDRALATLALDNGAGVPELLDYLCTGGGYSAVRNPQPPRRIPGLGRFLSTNPKQVAEAVAKLDAEGRARLCVLLCKLDAVGPNLDTVVALAVGNAKSVREAAINALIGSDPAALREAVAGVFAAKSTEPKVHATALLAQTLGAGARPLLEAQLANAPSKKLKDAVLLNLAALAGAPGEEPGTPGALAQGADEASTYRAVDGTLVEIPPFSQVAKPDTPFPDDLREPLRAAVEFYNTEQRIEQQKYPIAKRKDDSLEPRTADDVIAAANGRPVEGSHGLRFLCRARPSSASGTALHMILADPRVTLLHLLRLYQYAGWPPGKLPPLSQWYATTEVGVTLVKRMVAEAEDLRELVALHATLGCESEELARDIFVNQDWAAVNKTRARFVWPFLVEQTALFEEALGVRPNTTRVSLESVFAALELLPKVPQRLLPPLMRLALAGTKAQKRRVRDLIAGAPDLDASVAGLLTDGQAEMRADAALWLAKRKARRYVPRIRAALEKERSDKTRASFLRALTALGADTAPAEEAAPVVAETKSLAKAPARLKKTATKRLERKRSRR